MRKQSKLLVKLGITAGLLSLVFGVCDITAQETSSQIPQPSNRIIDNTKTTPVTPNITDRGGNRTITFYHMTDDTGILEFDSETEIDVTSITFSNGIFSTGDSDNGGFIITTDEGNYLFFMATNGFGTQQVTFPSPMMIRSGDVLGLYPQENTRAEWDITFQGRIPTPTGFKLK